MRGIPESMPGAVYTAHKGKGRARMMALLCCALVLAAFVCPSIAQAAPDAQATLVVEQRFINNTSVVAGDVFSYRLRGITDNAPMPQGSTAQGYDFTMQGNESVQIPIAYTQAGMYEYEIAQIISLDADTRYVYDGRVYDVQVHVDAQGNVRIVVYDRQSGEKCEKIEFTNYYKILPSDPAVMVDPPVVKTVTGSPATDGVFVFKLVAQDRANPMPRGSVNGVKTITVIGSGNNDFGTWSYTQEGTYYYTIYEVNTGEAGYIYDDAVYTITDSVKAVNGQLVVMRVVTNDNNKPVTSLSFINKYASPDPGGPTPKPTPTLIPSPSASLSPRPSQSAPYSPRPGISPGPGQGGGGRPQGGIDSPKTGDDAQVQLYRALIGVSLGMALLCILGLVRARRRQEVLQADE